MCPLGLEIEKIHACKGSRVLFCEEYADLDSCPKCVISRYKRKKDDGDNVGDGDEPEKIKGKKSYRRAPMSVAWYFPVISHLKCMLATTKEAVLLRWHKEGCKKNDGMMRHPADAAQRGHINV